MRRSAAFLFALTLLSSASPQRSSAPFVPVAVTYTVDGADRMAGDFATIRGLGFNSIRTIVRWADAEPARGEFHLEALEVVLDAAANADLKVIVEIDSGSTPSWLLREFPNGRFQPQTASWLPPSGRSSQGRACLDHPGVRDAATAFVGAVSQRAAKSSATYSIDVASNAPSGLCSCRYTKKRFDDWLAGAGRGSDRSVSGPAFVALERASDLELLATAARGPRLLTSYAASPTVLGSAFADRGADWTGQDDRSMSMLVDRYGTSFDALKAGRGTQPSAALAFAGDAIRSATRDKGWMLVENTEASAIRETMPSASDLRLRGWTAVSRGALGLTFPDWKLLGPPSGAIDNRARAAGAFASVITRNPALFAPLRPRDAAVAILYDPRTAASTRETERVYRILFERNVQVDIVDTIDAGVPAGRYKTTIDARKPPMAADALMSQIARAGVPPGIRVDATRAAIEMRVLESPDVITLIGLNHSTAAERVTLHFPPDTQEAIWQNMETGTAVNFVAGPDGPTYTHLFQPKDVLVLIIRRGIR
jgi:hypothetical protein